MAEWVAVARCHQVQYGRQVAKPVCNWINATGPVALKTRNNTGYGKSQLPERSGSGEELEFFDDVAQARMHPKIALAMFESSGKMLDNCFLTRAFGCHLLWDHFSFHLFLRKGWTKTGNSRTQDS